MMITKAFYFAVFVSASLGFEHTNLLENAVPYSKCDQTLVVDHAVCRSCTESVNCIYYTSYRGFHEFVTVCETTTPFCVEVADSASCGAVPPDPNYCDCNGKTGVKVGDFYDPQLYYYCVDGIAYSDRCPDNEEFDVDLQACTYVGQQGCYFPFTCTEEGFFPHPYDCTKYITCSYNGSAFDVKCDWSCDSGFMFSDITNSCIFVDPIQCTANGLYANPYECRCYYYCSNPQAQPAFACCNAGDYYDSAFGDCVPNNGMCKDERQCILDAIGGCHCSLPPSTTPGQTWGPTITDHVTTTTPQQPTTPVFTGTQSTPPTTTVTNSGSVCPCSKEGETYEYLGDCTKFYRCENVGNGLMLVIQDCPWGTCYCTAVKQCI